MPKSIITRCLMDGFIYCLLMMVLSFVIYCLVNIVLIQAMIWPLEDYFKCLFSDLWSGTFTVGILVSVFIQYSVNSYFKEYKLFSSIKYLMFWEKYNELAHIISMFLIAISITTIALGSQCNHKFAETLFIVSVVTSALYYLILVMWDLSSFRWVKVNINNGMTRGENKLRSIFFKNCNRELLLYTDLIAFCAAIFGLGILFSIFKNNYQFEYLSDMKMMLNMKFGNLNESNMSAPYYSAIIAFNSLMTLVSIIFMLRRWDKENPVRIEEEQSAEAPFDVI